MFKERSVSLVAWIIIVFILAVAACYTVTKPLPSNLEALATSPQALGRLQKAMEVRP